MKLNKIRSENFRDTVLCTCYLRQNVQVQQIGKADDAKMARRALSSFSRRKQWRRNACKLETV